MNLIERQLQEVRTYILKSEIVVSKDILYLDSPKIGMILQNSLHFECKKLVSFEMKNTLPPYQPTLSCYFKHKNGFFRYKFCYQPLFKTDSIATEFILNSFTKITLEDPLEELDIWFLFKKYFTGLGIVETIMSHRFRFL